MSVGYAYGKPAGVSRVQIFEPPNMPITHLVSASGEGARQTTRFRVLTPDSRLRVKISIFFLKDSSAGTDPISDMGATLYLGAEENDRSREGSAVLVTDILRDSTGAIVHQSSPLVIPEDAGLAGFSQEFVTAADSILGIFTCGSALGTDIGSGQWIAQVRYQPDGQRFDDEDWDRTIRRCGLSLLGLRGSV